MKGLTAAALDNSRLTILALIVVAIGGIWSYIDFPSREDPQIRIREAVVSVAHPGMPPERMEALIVRRLEEAISQMPEVEDIVSTVRTGEALIHVHLLPRYDDLDPIWKDLRNRVSDARRDLPADTLGPFVNDDFGDVSVVSLALTGAGFEAGDMRQAARDLRERLYAVRGVDRIELHGVRREHIYLEASNARLAEFELTPQAIITALREQNVIQPGGHIDAERRRIVVQPLGHLQSLDAIRNLPIAVPGAGANVYLRDIVDVRRTTAEPPERIAYFNGREAIILAVTMLPGENVLEFGPRLWQRAQEIAATLPDGFEIARATYQPEPVERAVGDVTSSLYQTLGIVLLVVVLFLGLRTGLIVGLMIPLTLLATLVLMRLTGIELHRVSLASMIISLGMLVSNFVAVAEDIEHRIARGGERWQAAAKAGEALALPLLAATLTTVLAFTPPLLATDEAGEYTRSLSLVIAFTLVGSWVLAMTAVPLACAVFLKPAANDGAQPDGGRQGRAMQIGRNLLAGLLRWRWAVLFVAALCVGAGSYALRFVPEQFFPQSERSDLMIEVDLPAGYSSAETDRVVREALAWLGDSDVNPEVERSVGYVGFGGPRFFLTVSPRDPAPHVGFIVVKAGSFEASQDVMQRARRYFIAEQPEARARLIRPFLGTVEPGLVELRLTGPDYARLSAIARTLETGLQTMPAVTDIRNSAENRIIKAVVSIDQSRARRVGVTTADIAVSLDSFFDGQAISPFYESDVLIPIVLRAEPEERSALDRLRTVSVNSARTGMSVPLLQVADFETVSLFGRINRRNHEQSVTISARHREMTAGEFQQELQTRLDDIGELPPGYRAEWAGETKEAADARTEVFGYVPYALAAIVALLVWQFNSLRRPLIIALTIPLALAGGVGGLLVSGSWFGFMAILGFISLGGIVVNYAILIVGKIDEARAEAADPMEAVIEGTLARSRAVLMMGLTTILGLLPLIIGRDVLFYDMANVIAYGLGVGMIAALTIAPILYAILMRIENPAKARAS